MSPSEKYNLKRKNFIDKAARYFRFLCDELRYDQPVHSFHQQSNGTIINDKMAYENTSIDRYIVLYNAYHPVDYGFEVQVYRPSVSIEYSDSMKHIIANIVLKEDQDFEQNYLKESAEVIKDKYYDVISGKYWKEY